MKKKLKKLWIGQKTRIPLSQDCRAMGKPLLVSTPSPGRYQTNPTLVMSHRRSSYCWAKLVSMLYSALLCWGQEIQGNDTKKEGPGFSFFLGLSFIFIHYSYFTTYAVVFVSLLLLTGKQPCCQTVSWLERIPGASDKSLEASAYQKIMFDNSSILRKWIRDLKGFNLFMLYTEIWDGWQKL